MTLFDFGASEDGSFYYVMELLDGVDTDTLIRRFGPLPAERVVHILCRLQRLETVPVQEAWTDARAREWWEMHVPSSSE